MEDSDKILDKLSELQGSVNENTHAMNKINGKISKVDLQVAKMDRELFGDEDQSGNWGYRQRIERIEQSDIETKKELKDIQNFMGKLKWIAGIITTAGTLSLNWLLNKINLWGN